MSQPTDEIAALCELVLDLDSKATAGPWVYRPGQHDDWGLIRQAKPTESMVSLGFEHGYPIMTGSIARHSASEIYRHRNSGTDPCGPDAKLTCEYRTAAPTLAREVMRLRELLLKADALADKAEGILENIKKHQNKGCGVGPIIWLRYAVADYREATGQ